MSYTSTTHLGVCHLIPMGLFVRDVRSGVTPEWKRVDNKGGGTTLASARALCLDRLSRVWLRISGGLNCCQESRRGVV